MPSQNLAAVSRSLVPLDALIQASKKFREKLAELAAK
jgi:hypothetical protein